jgi:hypothetical protein
MWSIIHGLPVAALDRQGERVGEILQASARLAIGTVTVGGHA